MCEICTGLSFCSCGEFPFLVFKFKVPVYQNPIIDRLTKPETKRNNEESQIGI